MASILRVNTLTDASSNNSVPMATVSQGTAKSWVNFNGEGTIASRDSFNVGSLTDVATATYNITFSTNQRAVKEFYEKVDCYFVSYDEFTTCGRYRKKFVQCRQKENNFE